MRKARIAALAVLILMLSGTVTFADQITRVGILDIEKVYSIYFRESQAVKELQQMRADVLREINRALRWNLPMSGPKTLNGLVLEYLETIPDSNLCLQIEEYQIETLQIKDNMVKNLKIRRHRGLEI